MAKTAYQVKIFNLLKEAGGPVPAEEIISKCGFPASKLSCYILYTKNDYNVGIRPIRATEGRKVVAYELVMHPDAPTVERKTLAQRFANPVAKPVKSKKAVVAPSVAAPVVAEDVAEESVAKTLKSDKLADIVGQMENDVSMFEDRMFAEDFVRSL